MVCEFVDHRQTGFLLLAGFALPAPLPPTLPHHMLALPCPALGPHQQFEGRAEKSSRRGGQGWAAEGLDLGPGFATDEVLGDLC